MSRTKYFLLGLTLALIVSGIIVIERTKPARVTKSTTQKTLLDEREKELSPMQKKSVEEKNRKFQQAPELAGVQAFINTPKTSVADLVGKKVILIDFWTYSCINCQRTTPYLNAWYEKYKDKGLEIIGVHTPEFDFEKKLDNVETAVKKFGIQYPVALDNDYSTWTAYSNRYWPRKYLIDIDGFIVYDHIGEGGYEETEKKIQALLSERMNVLGMKEVVTRDITKPTLEEQTDFSQNRSPEIYFGSLRNASLGNGKKNVNGIQNILEPKQIRTDRLYLIGGWDLHDEYAENKTSNAKIIFRYRGKNVYFVSGATTPIEMEVLQDGKPVISEKGADVLEQGGSTSTIIKEQRLYKLIRNSDYEEHTLELIIKQPNVQAFTFTFG
ncbi:redoxin domain-containing protein [Candidatus Uhrbacteria bacterium]|nr:redoxin domain-containing protein [Candidatus Uhrbacteria bacterium]